MTEEQNQTQAPKIGKLGHARILLVEDAPDNQALIARFLKSAGGLVEIANDGIEGIDKAMHGDFDVVLMDLQMPRMDGYEATRRLRAFGYKTPILALTAHALTGDREKCLSVGFSDHLAKPVEKGLLINAIQKFKDASA
jgi:CheY-like chemotaxis protein